MWRWAKSRISLAANELSTAVVTVRSASQAEGKDEAPADAATLAASREPRGWRDAFAEMTLK